MSKMIKRQSNETGKVEQYELIKIKEHVKVKNDYFDVLHEYYKRLSDGELFEPFDDPDKNLNKDYDLYRKKYSLLTAEEVKGIRKKYELNIRDFSEILGISYSNLSSIENGSLQAGYIDNLLRLADDPYALLQLINGKKNVLSTKIVDRIVPILNKLIIHSYEEHQAIAIEIKKYNLDIRNNIVRLTNTIELDLKSQINTEEEKGETEEWKSVNWTLRRLFLKK